MFGGFVPHPDLTEHVFMDFGTAMLGQKRAFPKTINTQLEAYRNNVQKAETHFQQSTD